MYLLVINSTYGSVARTRKTNGQQFQPAERPVAPMGSTGGVQAVGGWTWVGYFKGGGMKSDWPAIIVLILMGIFTFFMFGQRDMALDAQNARIALLEEQIGHGNIPRIEISGRAAVYAGSGSITIEKIENEKINSK